MVLREMARCAPTAFYSRTQNYSNVEAGNSVMGGAGGTGGGVVQHAQTLLPSNGSGGGGSITGLGGTNDFLDHILPAIWDSQPIVRACAADALSECLAILMERQPSSMTAPLCSLYSSMMEGLRFASGGASGGGGRGERSIGRANGIARRAAAQQSTASTTQR